MPFNPPRAQVRAESLPYASWRIWLTGAAVSVACLMGAGMARAQDTIIAHGYNYFDELKYPADFAHFDYVNPDAPKGGEISISTQGTFDTMNPYSREGRAGALSTIGYEPILTSSSDEVSSFYCLLCSTLEYPEDLSWVIFNLRPEVRFSDGTPMTADDIVFSFNLRMEQALPSYSAAVSEIIAGVEAIDDHTVKFTFVPESAPRDRIVNAGAISAWSKAWYESTGARLDESRMEISPGTGPYVLDSYDVNRQIIYRRNPDYWGNDLPVKRGHNNFDSIRIEYFADSTAAFEAFKAGEYTFRQENSSLVWGTQYEFPALDAGQVIKAALPNGNLPAATGFVFNLQRETLQDIRVRQALALMYNFTWTNETLQYGLFSQRESFWQNSALAATGVPEGRELELLQSVADQIDPSILTEPVTVPHVSGDQQIDRGNLRAALALLEEAGWVSGDDGRLTKDGQPLRIEFLSDNPNLDRIITPYMDNLQRLGVDAIYNRVDPAQYTNRTRDFDFDMILDGYTNSLEEGSSLSQRYGSLGLGDLFNPASYSSPAVDALIDVVAQANEYDEMAAGVRAIDRIMRRDLFIVPTWYNPNYWVAYFDMFEHPETLPPYALGHLEFWWYNEERAEALIAAGALR